MVGQFLVIEAQTTGQKPTECAFDNRMSGLHRKPFLTCRFSNDLQPHTVTTPTPMNQSLFVALIDPEPAQALRDTTSSSGSSLQRFGTAIFRNISRRRLQSKHFRPGLSIAVDSPLPEGMSIAPGIAQALAFVDSREQGSAQILLEDLAQTLKQDDLLKSSREANLRE